MVKKHLCPAKAAATPDSSPDIRVAPPNRHVLTTGRVCRFLLVAMSCVGHAIHLMAAAPGKPNIVLIMADDIGVEAVSLYGKTSYKTPNLASLANQGVRFDQCHATPLCTPSRVQIMTGRYPFRTGWSMMIHKRPRNKAFLDPEAEITLGQVLKNAGYATAVAGKWQLCIFAERPRHISNHGFDRWCCWDWLSSNGTRRSRYWNPILFLDGHPMPHITDRFGPDVCVEFLIRFMTEQARKGRPFFVYYPMLLAHRPFVPSPDTDTHAPSEDPPGGTTGNIRYFPDMVTYMDKLIGQLVHAIDMLGIRDNTVILFTADNGTDKRITSIMDGATVHGGKGRMHTTGTHVPLVVSWKGQSPPGTACHDLIDFTDFMPTLADLASTTPPRDRIIDGISFLPQILGKEGPKRPWIFCQLNEEKSIRTHAWFLTDRGLLYDLQNDPWETTPFTVDTDTEESKIARRKLQAVLDGMTNGESRTN